MTVTVRVTDDGGLVDTDKADIVVKNVAPEIVSLSSPGFADMGLEGSEITVSGTFKDVGIPDTHTAVVDWGDGTSEAVSVVTNADGTGSLRGTHTYVDGGIFEIIVTLSDDDGGVDAQSTTAVITGVGVNADGVLYVIGTNEDDRVSVNRQDNGKIKVRADFLPGGNFKTLKTADVDQIIAHLCDGDDQLSIAGNVAIPAIIEGGSGNDHLNGGGGPTILIGSAGMDRIVGGNDNDVLIGGTVKNDDDELSDALHAWDSNDPYDDRVAAIRSLLSVTDDLEADRLTGASGRDVFFNGLGDDLTDVKSKKKNSETVI